MTAATQRTPGPWKAVRVGNDFRIERDVEDGAIATVYNAPDGIGEGDASLIAAAPDLLALAQQFAKECAECDGTGLVSRKFYVEGIENDADDQPCDECADIRAVLAKVTP